MRRHTYLESEHTVSGTQLPADGPPGNGGLPNRLMTAFEVAEFVGCHEETVRRAYLRGLLDVTTIRCQRKEVSSRRRARLDSSWSTDESLVNERRSVWLFERSASRRDVARVRDATILGGST